VHQHAERPEASAWQLDDERRAGEHARVLPAREAPRIGGQPAQRQAGAVRVRPRRPCVARLRQIDEPEGLVVPDRQRRALAQDKRAQRAGLGLRERARSVHASASPALGGVAVEVDASRVAARAVGETVGVGVADEQQLGAGCRRRPAQSVDHRAPGTLVAVHAADDEDPPRRGRVADARDADRTALDGATDALGRRARRRPGQHEAGEEDARGPAPHPRRSASVVMTAS